MLPAWVAAAMQLRDGERVPVSTAHLKRFVDGGLRSGRASAATLGGPRTRTDASVEGWEEIARLGLYVRGYCALVPCN